MLRIESILYKVEVAFEKNDYKKGLTYVTIDAYLNSDKLYNVEDIHGRKLLIVFI